MSVDAEIIAVFRAEVEEQLEVLSALLADKPDRWDVAAACRTAHNIKGAARMVDVVPVRDVAHLLEDLLAAVRQNSLAAAEVSALARRGCRLLRTVFEAASAGQAPPNFTDFAEQVRAKLADADADAEPSAEVAAPEPAAEVPAPSDEVSAAPVIESGGAETLRVSTAKIDKLVALSAELITAAYGDQERLELAGGIIGTLEELRRKHIHDALGVELAESSRLARKLRRSLAQRAVGGDHLSARLQDGLRTLRLVPVESLRSTFTRVVREACQITGRQASLLFTGGDTEIDRAMLDALRDPLVHILRNAVAHGIESPQERSRQHKPAEGSITLEARTNGAYVELRVSDDGRGIAVETVRRAAVARAVLSAEEAASASEADLTDLIFRAGFSTAATSDEISGRGVGLDVVRRNLTEIGGQVAVSTEVGRGTTFVLRVPLTRLVTKGVTVRLGKQFFAAPITSVERTLFVSADDVRNVDGRDVVVIDNQPVRVVPLESLLRLPATGRQRRPAVVLADGAQRAAIVVDEVLGQRELAAQPLAWNLAHVPCIAGATVLDQKGVVMLLDVADILGARQEGRAGMLEQQDTQAERQRRVLVVDDSVTSRTLEKNILAAAGYDVAVATDGQMAWEIIQQNPPDLVVADVEMPRLDGLELTRRIRGAGSLSELPVILVTSLGRDDHKRRGAEAGANAYVVKGSFDQDELLRHVARLL